MAEGRRPEQRRRSPASRPSRPAETGRARPRATPARREPRPAGRAVERIADDADARDDSPESPNSSLSTQITRQFERQAEQRLGSTARRAAILAAVVCVLTLTIAGPVRTFFAQRAEMAQLAATEAQLRDQIVDLEEQKVKLADPVFVAAQARERLGFVMPGDIPYEVQLPPGAAVAPPADDDQLRDVPSGEPWYTSLWKTIAEPRAVPLTPPGVPAPPGAPLPTGAPPPGVPPGVPPPPPPPGG